jgi:uncharacterized oxidoreductase
MIDVLCGILSGSGVGRMDMPRGANGVWLYLIDIEQFLPRAEYDAWIAKYIVYLKSSRPAAGVAEILLPGEIEVRRQKQRLIEGVKIPDETWRQLAETATKLGVSVEDLGQ